MHVHVVYHLVWALIISTALCTIKQSKVILRCSWVQSDVFLFFFSSVFEIKEKHCEFILHMMCVFVVFPSQCFFAANFTQSVLRMSKHSSQHSDSDSFCKSVLDSPHTGNSVWSLKEAGATNLTGLLVRDTRRDSRQWNSFSSVMPERSSWTYSWDERVNSCLLFLSPPCE